MQLNKFLARTGLCSRRKAAQLIEMGIISVNRAVIVHPGHRVGSEDLVMINGKPCVPVQQPVYVLLNKPKGYVTTTADEHERGTVLDLCTAAAPNTRLFPVGRLDRKTHGVLLLTNDGALAQRLAHPRYKMQKQYRVRLNAPLSEEFELSMLQGIRLVDGMIRVDRVVPQSRDRTVIDIWLHSGRNRIIRRLLYAGGYEVTDLARVSYAGLTVRDIPIGRWRYLKSYEIDRLKRER